MLQGLFGNASEVNAGALQTELKEVLIEGETVVRAFRVIRDQFVFTNRRLILVDKQGVTGKKVEYHSIPYKSITHFSVETAGNFDLDAEMKIYISGNPIPIAREFKRGSDIKGVQQVMAYFILQ